MNETLRMPGRHRLRSTVVALCFLAIVIFLLFTEHRAHVLGFLPFGLLLLCPLLHLFHHGGHESHGTGAAHPAEGTTREHGGTRP